MAKVSNNNADVIDAFLANNPELEELKAELATFNAFRALGIEQNEIRHSNVLAWLLNPNESHGLDDIVLKRVMSNILFRSNDKKPISAAAIELMKYSDVEVLREWRHIDLLVIDRANAIILLIENKILSKESQGQLLKYVKAVEEEYPDFTKIRVFLTLAGEQTSDEVIDDFISYSYVDFLKVLETIYNQRHEQLAPAVDQFIRQYIETLKRLTMQDKKLTELCKKIYRKHREAIDLIIEYGAAGVGQQAIEDVLNNIGGFEVLTSRPSTVWFVPKKWVNFLPENGTMWPFLEKHFGVICWFEIYNSTIYLHFELSQMKEPNLRLTCAKELNEAGFKLRKKALDESAVYSRFYGKSQKINDLTDIDEVREAVEKIMAKAKEEFPKAEKVLRKVFVKFAEK